MKAILAIFVMLLPVTIICLLAWIISRLWEFPVMYFGLWALIGCVLWGFKILGAFDE